jgi:Leishmanolysin
LSGKKVVGIAMKNHRCSKQQHINTMVTPRSFSTICSSVLIFAFSRAVLGEQQQQQQQPPQQQPQYHRQHVIRNVYDTPARTEIRQLEERMYKYQTGWNADPDHFVPYENHPYDNRLGRRLAEGGNNANTNSTTTAFAPMRIAFYTKALDDIRDETNAAKIDWYKSQVMPKAAEFWSDALSVVPVSGPLRISSAELDSFLYCGDPLFTAVPNEHKSTGIVDADLVLYVSGSASERFCPSRTLAVAVPWYVH